MTRTPMIYLLLLGFSLVGCAGGETAGKSKPLCPQVAIIRSLEKAEDYANEAPDPANLVAVAAMNRVEGVCKYEDEGADIDFILSLAAEKGPRLGEGRATFPFFVSLVMPDDSVRAKEIMTAAFAFDGEAKGARLDQPLHVFIPLAKGEDAASMRVLMGFQLTEQQAKALSQTVP